MDKRIRTLVIVIGLVIVAMGLYYRFRPLAATIVAGNTTFTVELAMSKAEKQRGLGYRDVLAPRHGMLFVFDYKERHPFWMKGMRFPLDFVWLDGNRIVDITHNVPVAAGDDMPVYRPSANADRMLEINAGEAAAVGLAIGDSVIYRN